MTTYAIIFKGELREGFTPEAVKAAFQARGNLDAAQIEQVFSGKKVTLKKGLDRDEAKRFAHELRALGMRVIAIGPPAPETPASPDAPHYSILFAGEVVDGFSREAVMLMAAAKLKFSDAQRDLLFSGREVTMKRDLGEEKARNYLDTLRKLGMSARVEPPLPVVAPRPRDAAEVAAEASLVETQLAAPVYNYEETFNSSSTLEMAQEAMQDANMDDIHPSLRPQPEPALKPISEPTNLPVDAHAHVATVVNDDIVRAYEAELAGPDADLEALREAFDPAPTPPQAPVNLDFTREPAVAEPAPEPAPVAAPAPQAAPPAAAIDDDPEPDTDALDDDTEVTTRSSRSKTLVIGGAVLLVALIVLWVLM